VNPYLRQSQIIKQPTQTSRKNRLVLGKEKDLKKVVQKSNIILHRKMAKDQKKMKQGQEAE
jgi:hypothetical protein